MSFNPVCNPAIDLVAKLSGHFQSGQFWPLSQSGSDFNLFDIFGLDKSMNMENDLSRKLEDLLT